MCYCVRQAEGKLSFVLFNAGKSETIIFDGGKTVNFRDTLNIQTLALSTNIPSCVFIYACAKLNNVIKHRK